MIQFSVPGRGQLCLEHLVLDLNGTIAVDGQVLGGVAERMAGLRQQLQVHLLSADTRGLAAATAERLGVQLSLVSAGQEAEQKRQFVEALGAQKVIAVGNGANDAQMLDVAAIGVAVLGKEGLSARALLTADVVVASIQDALDLVANPARLTATLRY